MNDEARTNEGRGGACRTILRFAIRNYFVIRHSDFVIYFSSRLLSTTTPMVATRTSTPMI
jgi:hypothetical protein